MNTPELLRQLLQKKENQKLALEEDLILAVTDRICQLMEERGMSRADLAKKLGTSRAYVTGLLSGERNMTLRTLADVLFALGRRAEFRDCPFEIEDLLASPESEDCANDVISLKFDPHLVAPQYRIIDDPSSELGVFAGKMAI